jgi:Na+/melibiose symporter-like transporter
MMGNVVDYDELFTGRRREAIFYGTFSLAIGVGSSLGGLILPLLFNWLGYTRDNPLGVRAAFAVMSVFVLAGLAAFRGYRLGDTLAETRQNLALETAQPDDSPAH